MAKREKTEEADKPRCSYVRRQLEPDWVGVAKRLARLRVQEAELLAMLSEEERPLAERLAKDIAEHGHRSQ
uniref:Uncharacterized protein n=1 Tax=viral metagenome TaxID=1070528 RepID=A0A6M3M5T6_9ZZZZ